VLGSRSRKKKPYKNRANNRWEIRSAGRGEEIKRVCKKALNVSDVHEQKQGTNQNDDRGY